MASDLRRSMAASSSWISLSISAPADGLLPCRMACGVGLVGFC